MVLLGILALAVVGWLTWLAIQWFVADWRWSWITATCAAVPVVAYGLTVAWREPQPFEPGWRLEAWCSAVCAAVALLAPALVLLKGWGTASVALIAGISVCVALGWPYGNVEFPRFLPPVEATEEVGGADEAPGAMSGGQL
ncbi:hypothetical protein [Streptomyces sp. NPDC016845]|uniref:hypothetical protein n=1 Tax=Streptomyces sp. NPDC016845 TaxID=3364972 RepID=UPI0037B25FD8